MSKAHHAVLWNDATAGTGTWKATNPESTLVTLTMSIGGADTVVIEATNDVENLSGSPVVLQSSSYSASDTGAVLEGSYAFVRAVKTGTAGTSTILATS